MREFMVLNTISTWKIKHNIISDGEKEILKIDLVTDFAPNEIQFLKNQWHINLSYCKDDVSGTLSVSPVITSNRPLTVKKLFFFFKQQASNIIATIWTLIT